MRKIKRLLIALMAAVVLVSMVLPAAYAADTGALNGESGSWSDFDEGVYDAVTFISTVKNGKFDWPSSGTVLLKVSSSTYTLTGSSPNCIGIDIPAGLKVDIYKYYYPVGSTEKRYELLGHFDTTDGKSITIGKDTSTTGNSGSNSTSKPSNSGTIEEKWGNVRKTYHPGQTAKPYSNSYTDVTSNAWYYDAVMTLTEGGLLAGYGGGKFGPNDALTRGQVAIIVTRLVGNPMPDDYLNWGNGYKPYADNATASRAFAAIRLMGLIDRTGGETLLTEYETSLVENSGGLYRDIASNGKLTLATMWTAVYDNWRAGLAAGKQINYRTSIEDFPDSAAIHQWIDENWELMGDVLYLQGYTKDEIVEQCENLLLCAYNLGMVSGVDDKGTFDPYGNLTRGQVSQMLFNMGWTFTNVVGY